MQMLPCYKDTDFTTVGMSLKQNLSRPRHSCECLFPSFGCASKKWLTQLSIDLPNAMTDASRDDDDSGSTRSQQERDAPSPSAPAVAAAVDDQVATESAMVDAKAVTSSSAQEFTQTDENDEVERPREQEDFLDVVVTSADALDAGSVSGSGASGVVASAISASSSLLLGSQEYVVELVVTKGSGSYCIRRPLSELLAVLQAPDAASKVTVVAVSEIPEFPTKQSKNDALIAKWCGDMTQFLAGT